MNFKKSLLSKTFVDSFRVYLPVLLWCLGFFLGAFVGRFAEPVAVSWVLRAFQTPMSIDGLLASYYLPLLLWIALSQIRYSTLLVVFCFCEAFVFAYLMCCVAFCVPYYWMLLILLFCPAFIKCFSLLWLSVRSRMEETETHYLLVLMLVSMIAVLDYFVFSPYMSSITL